MDNFSNETIDTSQLPRFEEVPMTALHPNYWKVTAITLGIVFIVLGVALALAVGFIEEFWVYGIKLTVVWFILTIISFAFSFIAFRKKAFAFRNHDVLFRHGIIATTTIVVPYNRIQHVALHEGFVSRFFGLATIEIFTAGGSSSDIEIPGIEKQQAENIKQLLMGKIQKKL